ncbi:MAG TPA: hypothetical protein PKJ99_14175 [Thermoanaerobaculales bacterium]|nr:hypothetical protein [Thermoanaerobaculales bacterium]HQL30778.1 hypothetical protein [Thermoanaerobaculales bacterium]HQN97471.1 hypothetical protein [Thermoanaerobaculales bacterium]
MAGKHVEQEKVNTPIDSDDFEELNDWPQRQRVDPGEAAEYNEWRRERRDRGRKRRRPNSEDRRHRRDEDM